MSTLLVLFLAAFVYAFAVILALGIAMSAADADRLADRLLGPGSSDDLQLGLLVALDEANTPPAERRRV